MDVYRERQRFEDKTHLNSEQQDGEHQNGRKEHLQEESSRNGNLRVEGGSDCLSKKKNEDSFAT